MKLQFLRSCNFATVKGAKKVVRKSPKSVVATRLPLCVPTFDALAEPQNSHQFSRNLRASFQKTKKKQLKQAKAFLNRNIFIFRTKNKKGRMLFSKQIPIHFATKAVIFCWLPGNHPHLQSLLRSIGCSSAFGFGCF